MSKKNTEAVLEESKLSEQKQELKSIEVLAKELEIRETILAGKMLTKEELEEALLKFLNKTL